MVKDVKKLPKRDCNVNKSTLFKKLFLQKLYFKNCDKVKLIFSEAWNSKMDVAASQVDANQVKDDVAEK